eukprot:m.28048 g.28048  ORF g.28048 m.28048 type:complete len:129 (+) comp7966_c0_seq2:1327-1713(+)
MVKFEKRKAIKHIEISLCCQRRSNTRRCYIMYKCVCDDTCEWQTIHAAVFFFLAIDLRRQLSLAGAGSPLSVGVRFCLSAAACDAFKALVTASIRFCTLTTSIASVCISSGVFARERELACTDVRILS